MSFISREAQLRATLASVLHDAGESVSDELMDAMLKPLPVLRAADLSKLAQLRPGWYTASAAYEAAYGQTIPTQGLAVKLGHQLREGGWKCRMKGSQREYWIMPAGVEPDYHTA